MQLQKNEIITIFTPDGARAMSLEVPGIKSIQYNRDWVEVDGKKGKNVFSGFPFTVAPQAKKETIEKPKKQGFIVPNGSKKPKF